MRRIAIPGGLAAGLAAAALIFTLVPAGNAAKKVPGIFWGVAPQVTPTAGQFKRIKRGGVDSIRVPVPWRMFQPTRRGEIDFSSLDVYVSEGAKAGIEVFPFVFASPRWVAEPAQTLPVKNAKQRAAWAAFLTALVDRYGPQGNFWEENPTLPERPIRSYQIWNEPNFFFFVKRPNAAEYAKTVQIASRALKKADPGATVVLAGLFGEPRQGPPKAFPAVEFLNAFYKTPGITSSFDAVALHPYSSSFRDLVPVIEATRRTMRRNGDGGTDLWLTETGWGSGRGTAFEKGVQGQVRELRGAFSLFQANQQRWRLKRVIWFSLDNNVTACNFCDSTGLFKSGFKPKPAWFEYVKFAGGSPR